MQGDIIYFELPLDLARLDDTLRFYRTLFGWSIKESFISRQRDSIFQTPGNPISGGFDSNLKPSIDSINIYIGVDSIDKAVQSIHQEFPHTVVIKDKTFISKQDGSYALIIDPSGNKIGLNEFSKM